VTVKATTSIEVIEVRYDPLIKGTVLVARVTGSEGTPTGTITFTIDGTPRPPVPIVVVGGQSVATLVETSLAGGFHDVSVAYSGDSRFSASTASGILGTPNPTGTPRLCFSLVRRTLFSSWTLLV
jgi:hypothetical protein